MKQVFRGFWLVILAITLSSPLFSQSGSQTKSRVAPATHAATQEDIQSLRDTVQAQQKQIEAQTLQMQDHPENSIPRTNYFHFLQLLSIC